MKNEKMGSKRVCTDCGARYYDLMKEPPVCPSCGTVLEVQNRPARKEPEEKKEEQSEPPAVEATEGDAPKENDILLDQSDEDDLERVIDNSIIPAVNNDETAE